MQTFDSALFKIYMEGRISLEEALRNADSPNNLRLRINLSNDQPGQPISLTSGKSSFSLEGEEPPESSLATDRLNLSGLSLASGDD